MTKYLVILSVMLSGAGAANALAQRPPGDEAGVRKALDAYSQAFSRGQAPATGPAFTDDALYVAAHGERVAGREAIVKRLLAYLTTHKGDRLRMTAEAIRFVTPEIAEVDGNAEIRGAGGPPDISAYAALLVKQEGRWMIKSLRDLSLVDEASSMTAADHLKDLGWMVGEWSHGSEAATVKVTCRFDPSGHFLLWDYTVRAAGKDVMTVNQRVGWDAQSGSFRSWVFDSVGGFAEGRWDPETNGAWEIRQTGLLPDGSGASATCQLVPISKDSFRWLMTDRRVNGARLADVDLRFTRAGGAGR